MKTLFDYDLTVEEATKLIAQGADIEEKREFDETPLHYAVARDNLAVVELLLKRGANKEAKDKDHETPLHVAAKYGNLAVVELLLKHKANREAKDRYDLTAMHLADIYSVDDYDLHNPIIALLRKYGAEED